MRFTYKIRFVSAVWALVLVTLTMPDLAMARLITVTNKLPGPIWVGIQSNPGKPLPNGGGFSLKPSGSKNVSVSEGWAGRFWARTYCDSSNGHCQTGDCGNVLKCNGNGGSPPISMIEIDLEHFGGFDSYEISLVDGFNVKVSIKPMGDASGVVNRNCGKAACSSDINTICPPRLAVYGPGGKTIACKSACTAFNTDQYCCRGAHGKPKKCRSSDWPVNYPAFFKTACPDARSYVFDDQASTFACHARPGYEIVFG